MIKLTENDKKYLWSKLEYTKKKKATETENDIYKLLHNNDEISEEDFIKILNSLEFTFRKKLKDFDKPMNTEGFKSIQSKLPESWIGVKQSNLSAHKRKIEKEKLKNQDKKDMKHLESFNSFNNK